MIGMNNEFKLSFGQANGSISSLRDSRSSLSRGSHWIKLYFCKKKLWAKEDLAAYGSAYSFAHSSSIIESTGFIKS